MQNHPTVGAIAIQRFRKSEGTFPGSLVRLLPEFLSEFPFDFYLGESSLFRHNGADFQIYSAGFNQRDDGGSNQAGRQGH